MNAYPKCFPCQLETALNALNKITKDENIKRGIMLKVLKIVLDHSYKYPPPKVFREIMRTIKNSTQNYDPYKEDKKIQNQNMLKLYATLKEKVQKTQEPILSSLLLSGAGNLIDAVIKKNKITKDLNRIFSKGFLIDESSDFKKELLKAKTLLLIADNSGEVVLDKILIETLKGHYSNLKIFLAVRGAPVLNDVTFDDLEGMGFEDICSVISTGDDTPGIILEFVSDEFKEIFEASDLIIAKGQGNFETLESLGDPRIFFLFWAKCEAVKNYLGLRENGPLFFRSRLCAKS
jgi:uncharacterized protein with ATP-grasp and redox domains